jgi:hypothetical protein
MLIPGVQLRVVHLRHPVTYTGPGVCGRGLVGCRRPILWAVTRQGRRIPLDVTPDAQGRYWPHQASCPYARYFTRTGR